MAAGGLKIDVKRKHAESNSSFECPISQGICKIESAVKRHLENATLQTMEANLGIISENHVAGVGAEKNGWQEIWPDLVPTDCACN